MAVDRERESEKVEKFYLTGIAFPKNVLTSTNILKFKSTQSLQFRILRENTVFSLN